MQWEYKIGVVVNGTHEMEQALLNKEGADGWELIHVLYHPIPGDESDNNPYSFYFKRPKVKKKAEKPVAKA